jgi:ubiquinone biosynthesis protein COQ4
MKMINNKFSVGLIDLVKNFTPIKSNNDRVYKMIDSAIKGLIDPGNAEHISELGDLSSMNTLKWIKLKMEETEEGRQILKEQPRINEETIKFLELKDYKINTLGYNYFKYMSENKFSPNERPLAKYIPDMELAYICQRYKETHDFYHVLLGYGRSIPDEIAVKWFEALHLRLPSSSLSSIFGGLRLSISNHLTLSSTYLPHVIVNSNRSKFIMGYYFENRLDEEIDSLRKEINITPLNKYI